MQKSSPCINCLCILFCASLIFAKSGTVGRTSATYGYARTSPSRVAGGTYMVGRTGTNRGYVGSYWVAPMYYRRSTGCRGECGSDAPVSEGETQRIYAFASGTCSSHGCQEITENECRILAAQIHDSSTSTTSSCSGVVQSRCSYIEEDNHVRWCANRAVSVLADTGTSTEKVMCKCVVDDSAEGQVSSTYGYARTSEDSVSDGIYLLGTTGGNVRAYQGDSYVIPDSNCQNSNTNSCGRDATGETERIYTFREGTCASHGCKDIASEDDCASIAPVINGNGDSTGVLGVVTPGETLCDNAFAKCYYVMRDNDLRWCSSAPSQGSCTQEKNCVCACVVGVESSSVDVGLILGITFGCLFGACCLVGVWMMYFQNSGIKTIF